MSFQEPEPQLHLLKAALEATVDAVVITNRQGDIQWVNPAFELLTGYPRPEVAGKNPRILQSGKHELSFYQDLWNTIISGGVWHGELWNKRKNNSLYLEEQTITPIIDAGQKITHFVAIKRDITKQQQLQQQLQKIQKTDAISQLTKGIAHNFNNKLATILGYADLVKEDLIPYADDELNYYIQEIILAGKDARDLIRQMMAYSRKNVIENRPLQLASIAEQSIKLLSSIIPSPIKIITEIDESVPLINADPVQIHQMLLNLAVNASDAMNKKGILSIGIKATTIVSSTCHSCHKLFSGNHVELYVKDTGKGVSEKDLEHIFLPFYSTHETDGGMGMGLSALHGILHEQSGHVLVDSSQGGGANFRLLFPLDNNTNSAMSRSEVKQENLQLKSKKTKTHIILVDDEVPMANFLKEILQHYGYQVTMETDSKKALKRIKEAPDNYNLLISDQQMPYMTGIEMVHAVSSFSVDLPVIFMTGNNEDSVQFSKTKNRHDVLIKPFETQELLAKINEILL